MQDYDHARSQALGSAKQTARDDADAEFVPSDAIDYIRGDGGMSLGEEWFHRFRAIDDDYDTSVSYDAASSHVARALHNPSACRCGRRVCPECSCCKFAVGHGSRLEETKHCRCAKW